MIAASCSRSRCSSATRTRKRASSCASPSAGALGPPARVEGVVMLLVRSILGRVVGPELLGVEEDHAIAARLLGDVERLVGPFHERVAVPDLRMRPRRDAEAGGL